MMAIRFSFTAASILSSSNISGFSLHHHNNKKTKRSAGSETHVIAILKISYELAGPVPNFFSSFQAVCW